MPIGVIYAIIICYGRLMPNGIKAVFFAFIVHSTRLLSSTPGLWLVANNHYSLMVLGRAGSN